MRSGNWQGSAMKTLRILFCTCLTIFLASSAQAKPEYLEPLLQTYKEYADKLTDRSCANCHITMSDYGLNAFGKQVRQELNAANTKVLTAAILHKVEILDANGDGKSNLDEIKAGTSPGEIKPGAAPTAGAATTDTPQPPKEKPLVPKNVFHPAIVHFPIALFIASLILDLIGFARKSPSFFLAGWFNLVFGAITSFGGLASGYLATLRMHLPISGIIQQHMLLAIAGTVIMWILVALRAKRHENMSTSLRTIYFVLGAAGLVLISYSGHLGGVFVYGE
jgi:uncharacterized membrane protein